MAKYDFESKLRDLIANPTPQKASGFLRACSTNTDAARKAISEWWGNADWTEEQKFASVFPVLEVFRLTGELPAPKKAA